MSSKASPEPTTSEELLKWFVDMNDSALLERALTEMPAPVFVPEPPTVGFKDDILDWGTEWLAGQLQSYVSQPITYQRGVGSFEMRATFGRTMLQLSDELAGTWIEWTDRDFLIPRSSFDSAGIELPQRNDIIWHMHNGEMSRFDVLPYGNEPHWRWSDSYRHMLRIHTKRILTEAAV